MKKVAFMTHSLFDLSGRVALITGTSRCLGQYFARALARAGADIALTSRNKQSLSSFADKISLACPAFPVHLSKEFNLRSAQGNLTASLL